MKYDPTFAEDFEVRVYLCLFFFLRFLSVLSPLCTLFCSLCNQIYLSLFNSPTHPLHLLQAGWLMLA